MPDFVPSVTVDDVIDDLINVVKLFVGSATCVRGQVNRVPLPNPGVVFTEISTTELSVPRQTFNTLTDKTYLTGPAQINIQVDFYGESAGEWAKSCQTALRSQWGFDQFPDASIKPLHCQDAFQIPLISGEQQYITRWTLQVLMQYNPVISVPQDSANALATNEVVAVDVIY